MVLIMLVWERYGSYTRGIALIQSGLTFNFRTTQTKDLTKPVVGVRGAGEILDIVGDAGIPAVAIGMDRF